MKKLRTAMVLILATALLCLMVCGCSSTTQPQSSPEDAGANQKITVTLSVECSTARAQENKVALAISDDHGIILPETSLSLPQGSSAYDALRATDLVVDASESSLGVYVSSIQSLGERDCGGSSGWLFTVNGEFVQQSASKAILQNGDIIIWHYTCDGGDDVS